jgi:5-methylcytosine-specific restriction endonuclease McrA
MAREFQFRTPAQSQARFRQSGMCAQCGENLDDLEEHAHHVIPNQSGRANDPNHRWLAFADNCVVLCHTCHERVHENGRYRIGAVAPPDYFRYSHGRNVSAHMAWLNQMREKLKTVWP